MRLRGARRSRIFHSRIVRDLPACSIVHPYICAPAADGPGCGVCPGRLYELWSRRPGGGPTAASKNPPRLRPLVTRGPGGPGSSAAGTRARHPAGGAGRPAHRGPGGPGNPAGPTVIDHIDEPYIKAQVITGTEYLGAIMKLCLDKRGILKFQHFTAHNRVELNFEMPLSEIVFDFYDKLKSISKGYASFDYHPSDYKLASLVKLDILLNGESVDALSTLIHRDHAYSFGRRMCEKLKELIPRQQFDVAIQAAIGAKIIARETVKAVRKDVTAKCYGGDITRKRKLLEKQKEGKKRMRQVGNVEIPQQAFLAVLKLD